MESTPWLLLIYKVDQEEVFFLTVRPSSSICDSHYTMILLTCDPKKALSHLA